MIIWDYSKDSNTYIIKPIIRDPLLYDSNDTPNDKRREFNQIEEGN
jgi:hypothetical protein